MSVRSDMDYGMTQNCSELRVYLFISYPHNHSKNIFMKRVKFIHLYEKFYYELKRLKQDFKTGGYENTIISRKNLLIKKDHLLGEKSSYRSLAGAKKSVIISAPAPKH